MALDSHVFLEESGSIQVIIQPGHWLEWWLWYCLVGWREYHAARKNLCHLNLSPKVLWYRWRKKPRKNRGSPWKWPSKWWWFGILVPGFNFGLKLCSYTVAGISSNKRHYSCVCHPKCLRSSRSRWMHSLLRGVTSRRYEKEGEKSTQHDNCMRIVHFHWWYSLVSFTMLSTSWTVFTVKLLCTSRHICSIYSVAI